MRRFAIAASAACLLLAAAPAGDPNPADAQCLVALGQLSGIEDAKAQAMTSSAVHYYLGRLDGRGAGGNLEALLGQAAASMKPRDVQPTLDRCGAEMKRREGALQQAGRNLGRAQPPSK